MKMNSYLLYRKEENMNEYINLSLQNIESEHICCAIGDPKYLLNMNR